MCTLLQALLLFFTIALRTRQSWPALPFKMPFVIRNGRQRCPVYSIVMRDVVLQGVERSSALPCTLGCPVRVLFLKTQTTHWRTALVKVILSVRHRTIHGASN